MRLPFDFNDSNIGDDTRIKFSYTSSELHQNIEISLDGDEVSVDALLDAFQRFLGALGVCIPPNVQVDFVQTNSDDEDDDEDDDDEDKPTSFTLEDPEDDEPPKNDDQDGNKPTNKRKKK